MQSKKTDLLSIYRQWFACFFSPYDIRKHFRGVYTFVSFYFSLERTVYVTYVLDYRSKDLKEDQENRGHSPRWKTSVSQEPHYCSFICPKLDIPKSCSTCSPTISSTTVRSGMTGEWMTPDERRSSYTVGRTATVRYRRATWAFSTFRLGESVSRVSNGVNVTEGKFTRRIGGEKRGRVEGRDANHRTWR